MTLLLAIIVGLAIGSLTAMSDEDGDFIPEALLGGLLGGLIWFVAMEVLI